MSVYFFDSSAVVKRYIPEAGTHWVRSLLASQSHTILVGHITPVEVMSAVFRKVREKELTPAAADALQKLFLRHLKHKDFVLLHYDNAVMQTAINLLGRYTLRAYDAIQLATAVNSQQILQPNGHSVIFTTADNDLVAAAQQAGLATENPNQYK